MTVYYYYYYIFKQKSVISVNKSSYIKEEEIIKEKDSYVDLNENVKQEEVVEESASIKTTKINKNIDSKYLNLNLNNPTFTQYLHKSNKPFIGY